VQGSSHTHLGRRLALAVALLTLALRPAAAPADETQWRDYESRIQYGYYTEDVRALRTIGEAIAQDDSHDPLRGYYAALAAWRLAQLALLNGAAQPQTSPGALASRCVHELDAVLEANADFAAGLALRAACGSLPLESGGMHAPFAAHKPRKDLERALQLAPRDPRVLLLDAAADYQLPPSQGGNKERALPKLRRAVAAYESERAGPEPLPGWGAPEGYVLLARDLLDHGDGVGARDALERALLLAPEYVQARRLMARITSG